METDRKTDRKNAQDVRSETRYREKERGQTQREKERDTQTDRQIDRQTEKQGGAERQYEKTHYFLKEKRKVKVDRSNERLRSITLPVVHAKPSTVYIQPEMFILKVSV